MKNRASWQTRVVRSPGRAGFSLSEGALRGTSAKSKRTRTARMIRELHKLGYRIEGGRLPPVAPRRACGVFRPGLKGERGRGGRDYRRRRIWLSAISSRPLPRKARVVGSGVVATMKRCSAVLPLPEVPGFQMLTLRKNELEIWPLV